MPTSGKPERDAQIDETSPPFAPRRRVHLVPADVADRVSEVELHIAHGEAGDRAYFTPQQLELAGILQRWDPIGVYRRGPLNPKPNEYDDLVRAVESLLATSPSRATLARALQRVLATDYGIDRHTRSHAAARQLLRWWHRAQRRS